MTMGDRIAVMSLGVLQQLDTPQNLYDKPANKFVAGFIGSPSMNFVEATIQQADGNLYAVTSGFRMRVPDPKKQTLSGYVGQPIVIGIRPEHLMERSRIAGGAPADSIISAKVDVVELLGNEIFVYLDSNGTVLTARMDPDLHLTRGQDIQVAAPMDKIYFFDPKSEVAL
jgi:multiple sugar transport system ATP-binding protein